MGMVRFYLSTTFKVPREEMGPKDVQSDNVPVVCHSFSSPADETRASTSRQPLQSTTSCHDALASTCTSTRSTQPSIIDHNLSSASSNIIQFGPTCCGNEHDPSDTLPLVDDIVEVETSELTDQWPDTLFAVNDDLTSSPRSPTPPPDVVSLTVHRVKILEEMVNHFKNEHILHEQINFTFVGEAGSDFTGVSREAYTAFWSEFFIGEAEGEESRVPAINTKWQEEEWRAVGRILLKGFSYHGVFPLQLSFVFATALIHREDVKPEMLLEDFVSYLCPTERDLVQHALEGCIDDDEQEDLIDFFDRYGCRKVPMQDEMRSQVIQIAHKQLIQRPKYALDKMKEVAQTGLSMYFPSCVEIKAMYKSKKPTVKKVLNLLDACPTTQDENQALKYLQQFIRAQGEVSLKKLLRFLTSADIMCVDKIKVTFSKLEGLARRPIAYTCGPVLELPSTYQSYPEFRREMESLLSKEECFVMDIA